MRRMSPANTDLCRLTLRSASPGLAIFHADASVTISTSVTGPAKWTVPSEHLEAKPSAPGKTAATETGLAIHAGRLRLAQAKYRRTFSKTSRMVVSFHARNRMTSNSLEKSGSGSAKVLGRTFDPTTTIWVNGVLSERMKLWGAPGVTNRDPLA